LDVEVFSFNTLENAYRLSTEDSDLEHVTPYIYRNFVVGNMPVFHVTLDTPEDYEHLKKMFNVLPVDFRLKDIEEYRRKENNATNQKRGCA